MHMKATADRLFGDDYQWSILGAGRHQTRLVTMGAIMGGNVRVGLEDSLYLGKGELAESNADQVAKIVRILRELSLEIATPDEARAMLALKGSEGDQIGSVATAGELAHRRSERRAPAGELGAQRLAGVHHRALQRAQERCGAAHVICAGAGFELCGDR